MPEVPTMRYRNSWIVGLVIVWLLSTTSCLSLRSWFGEEKRLFDEAILGRWVKPGQNETYDVEKGQNSSYKVTVHDLEANTEDEFDAALARFDDVYYLDLSGRGLWDKEDIENDPWLAMTHLLVRLEMGQETLRFRIVDPDKLMHFVKKGQLEGVGMNVGFDATLIVSTTEELQTFLEKRGREADMWLGGEEDVVLRRE
jgi:hypothetical protein